MSAETLRRTAVQIREDCPIPEPSRGNDFIDFPTGFAIQGAGVEHADRCSAAQTGGVILCDCEAIYPAWRHWRTLLAVADWLEEVAERQKPTVHWNRRSHGWTGAKVADAVARAYLGGPS